MATVGLDHVNLHSANVERLAAFYEELLDLKRGPRPGFRSVGLWLYLDKKPIVHLVEDRKQRANHEPHFDHFAIRVTDLPTILKRIEKLGAKYDTNLVSDFNILQVNVMDPDGNRCELDFAGEEAAALPAAAE